MKIIAIVAGLFFSSIVSAQSLAGKWRGEFLLKDAVRAPFNFEIEENSDFILINGEERLNAGKVSISGDSVFIPINQFDNLLALKLKGNKLSGMLKRQEGGEMIAQVQAEKGKTDRFIASGTKPARDYSGKYEVIFTQQNGKRDTAVGLFKQSGNSLRATFLKPSGDTRFQEGIVENNKFYLSSFFGSSPGYYHGKFIDNNHFEGEQVGTKSTTKITGVLNADAKPVNAYNITSVKDSTFHFSLPDMSGKIVSLDDAGFKNKPVIISIGGTWCPNCMDETKFLSSWYAQNKHRGIEVITIHFERQKDPAFAAKVMSRYKERFNIGYTQLFGGTTAKEDIAAALPSLINFKSFPTTIFLDKNKRVVKIHSGFTGPATGKYYDEFIKEFNEQVNQLISSR